MGCKFKYHGKRTIHNWQTWCKKFTVKIATDVQVIDFQNNAKMLDFHIVFFQFPCETGFNALHYDGGIYSLSVSCY